MAATSSTPPLTERDVRAAAETMTIYPEAPGLWSVTTSSGSEHTVDANLEACTCSDMEYRAPDEGCKHIRRVEIVLEERTVPPTLDDVDEQIQAQREWLREQYPEVFEQ